MSRAATASVISSAGRATSIYPQWTLEVWDNQSLANLNSINIASQFSPESGQVYFTGSVNSAPKVTKYALEGGLVKQPPGENASVQFDLTLDGITYRFSGVLSADGLTVSDGDISPLAIYAGEDGSWSAQAQP